MVPGSRKGIGVKRNSAGEYISGKRKWGAYCSLRRLWKRKGGGETRALTATLRRERVPSAKPRPSAVFDIEVQKQSATLRGKEKAGSSLAEKDVPQIAEKKATTEYLVVQKKTPSGEGTQANFLGRKKVLYHQGGGAADKPCVAALKKLCPFLPGGGGKVTRVPPGGCTICVAKS